MYMDYSYQFYQLDYVIIVLILVFSDSIVTKKFKSQVRENMKLFYNFGCLYLQTLNKETFQSGCVF